MLVIHNPARELFNEQEELFYDVKPQTLSLEHSLVSISKWESKWKKPFLFTRNKTTEEVLDYVRCMTLTQNVDPLVYSALTSENIDKIAQYIDESRTATWFAKDPSEKRGTSSEVITSETIYYWMVTFNIPFDPCQKWHISRLLALIKICQIKNSPKKKMTTQQTFSQNRALNAARRKALNSKG